MIPRPCTLFLGLWTSEEANFIKDFFVCLRKAFPKEERFRVEGFRFTVPDFLLRIRDGGNFVTMLRLVVSITMTMSLLKVMIVKSLIMVMKMLLLLMMVLTTMMKTTMMMIMMVTVMMLMMLVLTTMMATMMVKMMMVMMMGWRRRGPTNDANKGVDGVAS